MNARSNTFEIKCLGYQANEVISALFHSILYYRTQGKVTYKGDSCYSIGTLGYEEVMCDFLDFAYVRCSSIALSESINKIIKEFVEKLRKSKNQIGAINLEFFSRGKVKAIWPFSEQSLVWEIWSLKLICVDDSSSLKERIEEILLDKLLTIVQVVNGNRCMLPPMPDQNNVDSIFDTSFDDAQPYLHRITYRIGQISGTFNQPSNDIGFKRLIKALVI